MCGRCWPGVPGIDNGIDGRIFSKVKEWVREVHMNVERLVTLNPAADGPDVIINRARVVAHRIFKISVVVVHENLDAAVSITLHALRIWTEACPRTECIIEVFYPLPRIEYVNYLWPWMPRHLNRSGIYLRWDHTWRLHHAR